MNTLDDLYYESKFTCTKEDKDIFGEFFLALGASSVTETTVSDTHVMLSVIHLDNTLVTQHIQTATVSPLDTEMEYHWINFYQGFYCCPTIYIHPSHLDLPQTLHPEDHLIIINPKDAFGDGRHPTTLLCASILYTYLTTHSAQSLCDIGTGTGILAIIAEKLGVAHIDAFDIEEASVLNAKHNMHLNQSTAITCFNDSIETFKPKTTYAIVVANLLSILIEKNIHTLLQCVDTNGILILSGIGIQWKKDIEATFTRHNLIIIQCLEQDQWLAYQLKKIK